MNLVINIAMLVALTLGATGISTQQAGVSNGSTGGRGQNLNHNETIVRDTTTSRRPEDTSPLAGEQSFISRLFTVSSYRARLACPPIMCNHNETLVRDTTPSRRPEASPLAVERSFNSRLFTLFSLNRAGSGCSFWVCGVNHNETLVRETELKNNRSHHPPEVDMRVKA